MFNLQPWFISTEPSAENFRFIFLRYGDLLFKPISEGYEQPCYRGIRTHELRHQKSTPSLGGICFNFARFPFQWCLERRKWEMVMWSDEWRCTHRNVHFWKDLVKNAWTYLGAVQESMTTWVMFWCYGSDSHRITRYIDRLLHATIYRSRLLTPKTAS